MTQVNLVDWFDEHRITEVECLVPDITGIPRGKIMPAQKFLQGTAPRLPEAIFIQSVTGEYPEDPQDTLTNPAIIDIRLIPDAQTVRLVPWAHEPTAQIIHGLPICRRHAGADGAAPGAAARAGALRGKRLEAGAGAGTGILSGRPQHRPGLPADPAGGGAPGGRKPGGKPIRSTRSTSSIRSSRKCMISATCRISTSTR